METPTSPGWFPPGHLLDSPQCRAVLEACLRRLRRWRVPPHWSCADWHEEIGLEAMTAAQEAALDFDDGRGIPPQWFVRRRVLNRALDFYRKEWAFGLRWSAGFEDRSGAGADDEAHRGPGPADTSAELLAALARLTDEERWLIDQLYWKRAREADVAQALGISQQAVNRRKRLILQSLRRHLANPLARAEKTGCKFGERPNYSSVIPSGTRHPRVSRQAKGLSTY